VSNYPNPFNPRTTVQFDVPMTARVDLCVYDVSGRKVRTLVDSGSHDPGRFSTQWDGKDDRGTPVAAGVYFARLSVAGEVASGKMVMLK
jgi:flagellar hook assembly protein FlgD